MTTTADRTEVAALGAVEAPVVPAEIEVQPDFPTDLPGQLQRRKWLEEHLVGQGMSMEEARALRPTQGDCQSQVATQIAAYEAACRCLMHR